MQIAVIGSGAEWVEQAEEVGRLLADRGCTVVCGGLGEVMAAAARGAKEAGGTTVGTIDSVTADSVTITLASGTKVQLARSAVRGNADGTVTIGLSAEQLEAQVQAAGANASSGQ